VVKAGESDDGSGDGNGELEDGQNPQNLKVNPYNIKLRMNFENRKKNLEIITKLPGGGKEEESSGFREEDDRTRAKLGHLLLLMTTTRTMNGRIRPFHRKRMHFGSRKKKCLKV